MKNKNKRLFGAMYSIFLARPLAFFVHSKRVIEVEHLRYCQNGCKNCYKWKCAVRTNGETPYKKFRKN